jgi:hypothetical protein
MANVVEQVKAKVRAWAETHRRAVLYDEESSSLMDVTSGKAIRLPWQEVNAFEEKVHPETKDSYLVLLFENGTQVALVDPGGVAFAPSTENSGRCRTSAGGTLKDSSLFRSDGSLFMINDPRAAGGIE